MEKVKLGMVGCGARAYQAHFSNLKNFPDVEFAAFCDLIEEKAMKFAGEWGGGKIYTDYKAMLDNEKLDAVYICVPPNVHSDIEMYAIEKGIPFFIEKPTAITMDKVAKIAAAVEKKNLLTCVGFQDRYLDLIARVVETLKGHELGLVNVAWVGGIPGVSWWQRKSTSGGQIVEQHIHHLDLLRYIIGEPTSVYTAATRGKIIKNRPDFDQDDFSTVLVTFQNGVIATINTGCYMTGDYKFKNGIDFHCADIDVEYRLRNHLDITTKNEFFCFNRVEDSQITLNRTFIDAVKSGDGSKIRSPYGDATKTMRFALACQESAETGKIINL